MMVQLRENNVSVWRDNFMRDLQSVGTTAKGAKGVKGAKAKAAPARRAVREKLTA